MIIGGLFFAIASIIIKESIDKNLFTDTQILSLRAFGLFFAAGIPFMNKKNFRNLSTFFVHKKRGAALFIFETIFPLLSMYLVVVSLNYIEVSIVNSFNGARPIFTVLFSIFLAYILQRNTQEKVDSANIFIKFISGILALLGIILLA